MTVRIAVNGLGRIGRCVVRAIKEMDRKDIELVAVNGPADTDTHIHLLSYDSVHGAFPYVKKHSHDVIDIGFGKIQVFHERDPHKLPWKDLGVDVVFECTGIFKTKEEAASHMRAGAKKVLISAPSSDADNTIVYGVNHNTLKASDDVVSVGSCTTNCLAPVAKLLEDHFGIEKGYMTTIHAYTNDQNIIDNSHKDLRRARAAAMSMIPTSTGAAKALSLVIPSLKGKLDGTSMRVPTPNVSCVDLNVVLKTKVSVDQVHQVMQDAAKGDLKGILAYNDKPLVSIDFNHSSYSSIFDATGTKIVSDNFLHVMAWYDNEWGFSNRMLDLSILLKKYC